jgi:hypothetical protein
MMGMPAATKKGGQCLGAPDVCKVPAPPGPPVPTPFPNSADCSGATKTIKKVLISKKETVVETSKIKSSKGDEAGTLKGMVSNTHRDQVQFKKYSSKVYAKNKKIVHHTALTTHNGSNANMPAGNHLSPSQTKVLVAM